MKLKTIFAVLIILCISISLKAQEKVPSSMLYVTVTDFEKNPSPGDKIFFVSKKTGKIYYGISGKDGQFQISLPNGSEYEVKIKAFDQDMNYTSVVIEESDKDMEFDIGIMYKIPPTYTLEDVNFDYNSAKLKSSSFQSLNELAEFMLHKTTLKIELAGHTDSDGEADFNLELSQNRAESVRNYLIKKGVPSNRVTAVGYGETQPVASNQTDEGKKKNRRTEVRILEQ